LGLKFINIGGRNFVTAANLAEIFGVHKRTVQLWAGEQKMPMIKVGNLRLFDLADVSD
jgi:excisionase family DNA binding protein